MNLLHEVRKFMRQEESYIAGVGKIGREIYLCYCYFYCIYRQLCVMALKFFYLRSHLS